MMQNIPSPYSFVPHSGKVNLASRIETDVAASQDVPFEDGLSGTVSITVTNETPLFIRGTQADDASYEIAGKWAIPGSSVRGLIRSVVEMTTFSRLGPINDVRYGFRDLNNTDRTLYSGHMAGLHNGQPVPKVSACWLKRVREDADAELTADNAEETVATLEIVNFAKVEDGMLKGLAPGFDLLAKNTSVRRYAGMNLEPGRHPKNQFDIPLGPPERLHGAIIEGYRCEGEFRKAKPGNPKVSGNLVLTGQPTTKDPDAPKKHGAGNPKHHDFFFYGTTGVKVDVSRAQYQEFAFIHSGENDARHGVRLSRNTEWEFLGKYFDKGDAVPVFAIFTPNSAAGQRALRSFGLCSMFRLAYDCTTGDLLANTQHDPKPAEHDAAQAIFGTVPVRRRPRPGRHAAEQPPMLKGRISFDTLVGPEKSKAKTQAQVTAVFGAPKPSFYPNYVEQNTQPDAYANAVQGTYKTYMTKDARLRGWKRYALQDAIKVPPLPDKAQEHQKTHFRPLPGEQGFTGQVRFHNLRPWELGAVLWALDFGGDPTCRHALGLAKPYGYGRVKITIGLAEIVKNSDALGAAPHDGAAAAAILDGTRAAFVTHMDAWCISQGLPAWADTAQVRNLKASATPFNGNPVDLRYPTIKPNEFSEAKKANLVLQAPVPAAAIRRPSAAPSTATAATPGKPAAAAPVQQNDEAETWAKALRQAAAKGGQFALAASWAKANDNAAQREGGRRALLPFDDKRKAKYPELWEWLKPSG